jgi:hypothetical protein
VGYGLGGQLLSVLGVTRGVGSHHSAPEGGFDLGSLVGQVAGGGVGGAIVMMIVGLIKQALVK